MTKSKIIQNEGELREAMLEMKRRGLLDEAHLTTVLRLCTFPRPWASAAHIQRDLDSKDT